MRKICEVFAPSGFHAGVGATNLCQWGGREAGKWVVGKVLVLYDCSHFPTLGIILIIKTHRNMANRKDPDRQKESSTAVRHGLELKLQETLSEWKERLGEKKFNKRIKKAVKAFVRDLPLTATKKVKPVRKTFSETSRALAAGQ